MECPLISVIIPVYNVEPYIEECMISLLKQTYHNLEIIVVDDGSTDKSIEKAKATTQGDNRFTYYTKEHSGLSDTRNMGIEQATGEYFYFVDPDDFIFERSIERLYHVMEATESDIAVANYAKYIEGAFYHHSDNLRTVKLYSFFEVMQLIDQYHDDMSTALTTVWNKLYKKYLFDDIRFPSGKLFEDCFVTWKLYKKSHKIAFIESIEYAYRSTPNSIVQSYSPQHLDRIESIEERIHYLAGTDYPMEQLYRFYRAELDKHMYKLLEYNCDSIYYEMLKQKMIKIDKGDYSFLKN